MTLIAPTKRVQQMWQRVFPFATVEVTRESFGGNPLSRPVRWLKQD